MTLELDRQDLLPEHADLSCSKIRYGHLSIGAQLAVEAVGRATFYEYDRRSYNAVYPPKKPE